MYRKRMSRLSAICLGLLLGGCANESVMLVQQPLQKNLAIEFSPPPSATISYDVHAKPKDKQDYHAVAEVRWNNDINGYELHSKFKALFFTLTEQQSTGLIRKEGLLPYRFGEKTGSKPEKSVFFDYSSQIAKTSVGAKNFAIKPGVQDPLSIYWQQAGICRANLTNWQIGTSKTIETAAFSTVDFNMQIMGKEELTIKDRKIAVLHVENTPSRSMSFKVINVWYSLEEECYPIKILRENQDGSTIEMLMASIVRVPSNSTMSAAESAKRGQLSSPMEK